VTVTRARADRYIAAPVYNYAQDTLSPTITQYLVHWSAQVGSTRSEVDFNLPVCTSSARRRR
jgi:hypothetical protein